MGKARDTWGQDPPYMEIRRKTDNALNTEMEEGSPRPKLSSRPKVETSYGLSLPLGDVYEKKKQKLEQELRMDYRRYMAQKKDVKSDVSAQGLSLPIGERKSAKARLRNERNKEYNQFLRGQERQGGLMKGSQQVQNRDGARPGVPRALPDPPDPPSGPSVPAPRERLPSRRDAATLTEERVGARVGAGARARAWVQARQGRRRWDEGPTRPLVDYDSEQDDSEEEEGDFAERRKARPSRQPERTERRGHGPQHRPEGEMMRRRERTVYDSDDYPEMGHYVQRPRNDNRVRERRKAEEPLVREDDYKEVNLRTLSALPNPRLQGLGPAEARERARSVSTKDRAEFATGLMIGAPDGELAVQARKERYRLELLEQMAEQQRNKRQEKELELRVAATGAIDPEKKPDRIRPFGAVNRDHGGRVRDIPYRAGPGLDALGADSDRGPPERPRVAFQAPRLDHGSLRAVAGPGAPGAGAGAGAGAVPPLDEDRHRGLSSVLGELVTPRVTDVPPPHPPTLAEAYKTPYDEAYYYYGARNPLDPSLAHYGPAAGGEQPVSFRSPPPGAPQHGRVGIRPQVNAPSGQGLGVFPMERPKQSKESVLRYQESLKQQIRERQERKRREKEEKECYDAKLEAEMRAYNPWGKGGGGAPLRDSRGGLITDLNRMHRVNEEAYLNPGSRGKRAAGSVGRNVQTPGGEEGTPAVDRIKGFPYAQMPSFARGNPFTDLPTPQQLHEQDQYRDYLEQQIEEKRRKEAQERERFRLEEEQEEKKLADQRARIQREYEEEQERKRAKERQQNAQNEAQIRLLEERHQEEEKRKREAEERKRRVAEESERAQLQETPRQPSPPIPVVQKRLASQQKSRPPSVVSHRPTPALSERSMSVPPSPPVPARRNQLRAAEEQPGVISELSALRTRLRSEQRRLDRELRQTDREELDSPLGDRRREDVFDMARLRLQTPVRRKSVRAADPVNLQNIRDFNQLKYRDSESREEVRQTYPDPPVDDWTLELQQQALLREQQRRIQRLRRRDSAGYFDLSPPMHQTHDVRKGSAPVRGCLLESESAFIDGSADTFPAFPEVGAEPDRRARSPSPGRWRGAAKRMDFENETPPSGVSLELADPPDPRALDSAGGLSVQRLQNRNQRRIRLLEEMSRRAHSAGGSTGPSPRPGAVPVLGRAGDGGVSSASDDGDSLLLRRATPRGDRDCDHHHDDRRCSVETFLTEPWMRPGTSDTLKRFMAGQSRRERPSSGESLAHHWEGPSTYHG